MLKQIIPQEKYIQTIRILKRIATYVLRPSIIIIQGDIENEGFGCVSAFFENLFEKYNKHPYYGIYSSLVCNEITNEKLQGIHNLANRGTIWHLDPDPLILIASNKLTPQIKKEDDLEAYFKENSLGLNKIVSTEKNVQPYREPLYFDVTGFYPDFFYEESFDFLDAANAAKSEMQNYLNAEDKCRKSALTTVLFFRFYPTLNKDIAVLLGKHVYETRHEDVWL